MPLTLALRPGAAPIAPVPPLRLDGRGAVIGRSADADWRLPDPRSLVSSRHCEVAHRDGVYLLVDTSTNGTFVNGKRLTAPHRLANGDTIGIGDFDIAVRLEPGAATGAPPQAGWDRPAQAVRPAGATAIAPAAAPAPPAGAPPAGAFAAFLHGAGIDRAQIRADEATVMVAAGTLLRRLVTVFRAMDEDRARARGEIGAPAAPAAGNNPLVATRSAEQALAVLLAPPQANVVPAARAIDDVAQALELHRRAVLKAMQAALGRTVEAVGPAAIRARAPSPGLLARLSPGGADAALWRAYERGFDPAAGESGFVAIFTEEYRKAYTALTAAPPG